MPFAFDFNPFKLQISYSQWLSPDGSPVENLSSRVSLGSPLCSLQGRGKAAVYIHFYLCNFVMLCSCFGCHFIFSKVTSIMSAEAQGRIQTLTLGASIQLPKHRYIVKLGGSHLASSYCSGQYWAPVGPKLHMPTLQGCLKQHFTCNKDPIYMQVDQTFVGSLYLEQSVTA